VGAEEEEKGGREGGGEPKRMSILAPRECPSPKTGSWKRERGREGGRQGGRRRRLVSAMI
jgi:hypothetical protein